MSASEKFAYEGDPASRPAPETSYFVEETLSVLRRISAYLSNRDVATMRHDLEKRIREHPGASVTIGFGVGLIIGKLIKR